MKDPLGSSVAIQPKKETPSVRIHSSAVPVRVRNSIDSEPIGFTRPIGLWGIEIELSWLQCFCGKTLVSKHVIGVQRLVWNFLQRNARIKGGIIFFIKSHEHKALQVVTSYVMTMVHWSRSWSWFGLLLAGVSVFLGRTCSLVHFRRSFGKAMVMQNKGSLQPIPFISIPYSDCCTKVVRIDKSQQPRNRCGEIRSFT